MANAAAEKTPGLKFAEQQLLRHGWERGKGLGKKENGITEAIKVKIKCDKGGMGHKEGEQFTFHWWDHVFNKASASLEVKSAEDGVKVKKVAENEGAEGMVSNKKPSKAALSKAKLYGRFVKSATLMSGEEHVEKASSSEDSSSSDEEQRLDLSTTSKLSDEDLMRACGGRTAHKGARHGLTMSAKLARLEQQEMEFLAKYGKNSKPVGSAGEVASCLGAPCWDREANLEEGEGMEGKLKKSKKKKKRSKESLEEAAAENDRDTMVNKKRKKKKHSKERCSSPALGEPDGKVGHVHPAKRKCLDKEETQGVFNEGPGSSKNGGTLYASEDYKDQDAFRGALGDDGAVHEENVEECLGEEQLAEAAVPAEDSTGRTKKKKKKKKKDFASDVTEQVQDEETPDQQRAGERPTSRGKEETAVVRRSKSKKKAKELGH